jgi:hypothetical protein
MKAKFETLFMEEVRQFFSLVLPHQNFLRCEISHPCVSPFCFPAKNIIPKTPGHKITLTPGLRSTQGREIV